MLRSLLIGLGLITARLLDCNAQVDYEDVGTAGDATAPIGSGATTEFETDDGAQGPDGADNGEDTEETATANTSEDDEIKGGEAGRTAGDCRAFGNEELAGITAATNPGAHPPSHQLLLPCCLGSKTVLMCVAGTSCSECASMHSTRWILCAGCIVPGYVFKPEFHRYGGDLYQTWGVEGPRDVRKFCERELGCAAFNWPWGIIKTVGVNASDPSSFDLTRAFERDDLREADCDGLYIRTAGPVRAFPGRQKLGIVMRAGMPKRWYRKDARAERGITRAVRNMLHTGRTHPRTQRMPHLRVKLAVHTRQVRRATTRRCVPAAQGMAVCLQGASS